MDNTFALRLREEDVPELVLRLMRQVYLDLMTDSERFTSGRIRVDGHGQS